MRRAGFGAQDVGKGAAVSEGEAPGLAAGGGYRDLVPGLNVQSPSFELVRRTVGRGGTMGTAAVDTPRGCGAIVRVMRAAATDTGEGATAALAWVAEGLAVKTPPRTRREGAHGKAFKAHQDMRGRMGHIESQEKTR